MTMNNDIRRNGSGYCDPTAFSAISNYIKGEKVKKVNKMKQGEIWEIHMSNGTYRNAIVLAAHDDIAQIVQLGDASNSHSIEVNCQGIMYTDPRRVQYTYNDTFTNYIRTLKSEEFEQIMNAVADYLGLSAQTAEEAVEPVNYQEDFNDKVRKSAVEFTANGLTFNPIESDELIRAKTERDVYKGLYEKLLESVMKG